MTRHLGLAQVLIALPEVLILQGQSKLVCILLPLLLQGVYESHSAQTHKIDTKLEKCFPNKCKMFSQLVVIASSSMIFIGKYKTAEDVFITQLQIT